MGEWKQVSAQSNRRTPFPVCLAFPDALTHQGQANDCASELEGSHRANQPTPHVMTTPFKKKKKKGWGFFCKLFFPA